MLVTEYPGVTLQKTTRMFWDMCTLRLVTIVVSSCLFHFLLLEYSRVFSLHYRASSKHHPKLFLYLSPFISFSGGICNDGTRAGYFHDTDVGKQGKKVTVDVL